MLSVITCMISGILLGFIFRKKRFRLMGRLVTPFVCILLFVMGIEVGGDPELIRSLPTLGGVALFIALCVTLGSLICAGLWEHYLKKHPKP